MSQLAMLLPSAKMYSEALLAQVRVAGPEDASALRDLLSAAFPEEVWTVERVHSELLDAAEVSHVFVVDSGDEISATASAKRNNEKFPDMGYVHWVAVNPQNRGQSLGRHLVGNVISVFNTATPLPVVLETDDFRLPALASYLGMGFVPHYIDDDHTARWSTVFSALAAHRQSKSTR